MENRNILNKNNLIAIAIILLAAATRFMPHPDNFTPIGGLALFSGAYFTGKKRFFIPLLAMIVSDVVIGFHSTMPYVYGAFLLTIIIGHYIKHYQLPRIAAASLFSSFLFFVITNFGVWASSTMYEHTLKGLVDAYIMGIPFFKNTVMGDLFYTFTFFYGYSFVTRFVLNKKLEKI